MKNLIFLCLGVLMSLNAATEEPRLDFDRLWNYREPAQTEEKFRALIPEAREKGPSYYLQLQTQIARTQSLQSKFIEAYEILSEVSTQLDDNLKVARVRYLLELGRTQNSEKKGKLANQTFHQAFEAADQATEWGYAVDALHMIALTYLYGELESPEGKLEWEANAIAYAEEKDSVHAKAWLGSLYFNAGWSYYELEHFDQALETFVKAYELDKEKNSPDWILLDDRRTIAMVKRRLGRIDEALEEQHRLEAENMEKLGKPDGFVFEELGELYLLKQEENKARDYFAQAYPLIKEVLKDPKYAARLERVKALSGL